MLVEGADGPGKSKLVIRTNRPQMGAEMLFEATNGYSVVFSGAMLKDDLENLPSAIGFVKVATLDKLLDSNVLEEEHHGKEVQLVDESSIGISKRVRIWC